MGTLTSTFVRTQFLGTTVRQFCTLTVFCPPSECELQCEPAVRQFKAVTLALNGSSGVTLLAAGRVVPRDDSADGRPLVFFQACALTRLAGFRKCVPRLCQDSETFVPPVRRCKATL